MATTSKQKPINTNYEIFILGYIPNVGLIIAVFASGHHCLHSLWVGDSCRDSHPRHHPQRNYG